MLIKIPCARAFFYKFTSRVCDTRKLRHMAYMGKKRLGGGDHVRVEDWKERQARTMRG